MRIDSAAMARHTVDVRPVPAGGPPAGWLAVCPTCGPLGDDSSAGSIYSRQRIAKAIGTRHALQYARRQKVA